MEKIDYDESDVTSFCIVFPTFTAVLQAETEKEAKDWVEKIKTGEKPPSISFDNYKYY